MLENSVYMPATLVKLLHINLYAQLCLDKYEGPLLPDDLNAGNYAAVSCCLS